MLVHPAQNYLPYPGDRDLYTDLNTAFDAIVRDAFCGIQVPKRRIPKPYLAKIGIDDLWKYNLSKCRRLMYFVVSNGSQVLIIE